MFTITREGKLKARVKYKEPKKHGGKEIKREACLGGGDVYLEVSSVPQFPSPSNSTRYVPAFSEGPSAHEAQRGRLCKAQHSMYLCQGSIIPSHDNAVPSFSTIRLKREMGPELYSRIFSQ